MKSSPIDSRELLAKGLMAGIGLNLLITSIHFTSWLIAPFETRHSQTTALLILLTFLLTLVITLLALRRVIAPHNSSSSMSDILMEVDLRWPIILALLGLAFHLTAKYFILKEVNFDCMDAIRSSWREYNHSQDALWLRTISMSGYVLAHFAMPVLFVAIFRLGFCLKNLRDWVFLIVATAVITVFALAIVSRMVLLTALVIGTLAVLLSLINAKSELRKVQGRTLLITLSLVTVFGTLNALVAKNKVNCNGGDLHYYVSENIKDAGAQWKAGLNDTDIQWRIGLSVCEPSTSSSLSACKVILPTLHYLNHGIWNLTEVTNSPARGNPELFAFVKGYLGRLGFTFATEERKRVFGAGGIGLAGASFHDFGWSGVILIGLSLGMAWVMAVYLLLQRSIIFWLGLTLFACTGLTMSLQFLFVGPATISFPFTALAFLLFGALHCISRRKKLRVPIAA